MGERKGVRDSGPHAPGVPITHPINPVGKAGQPVDRKGRNCSTNEPVSTMRFDCNNLLLPTVVLPAVVPNLLPRVRSTLRLRHSSHL